MQYIFKKLVILVSLILCAFSTDAQIPREAIEPFIEKWIGVPYRYAGNSIKGIDCSGLTQKMAKEIFGIDIGRSTKYQMRDVKRVNVKDIQPCDLIFFKSKGSPTGYHVGFYLWDGKFMHAASRKPGVIISELSGYPWMMIGRLKTALAN